MNDLKSNRLHGSPDDLDGLLYRFFQAELPQPWPELKLPGRAPRTLWAGYRSKLALAASIALLLLGSWLLAGRTTDYSTPALVPTGSGTADKNADPMLTPVKP